MQLALPFWYQKVKGQGYGVSQTCSSGMDCARNCMDRPIWRRLSGPYIVLSILFIPKAYCLLETEHWVTFKMACMTIGLHVRWHCSLFTCQTWTSVDIHPVASPGFGARRNTCKSYWVFTGCNCRHIVAVRLYTSRNALKNLTVVSRGGGTCPSAP